MIKRIYLRISVAVALALAVFVALHALLGTGFIGRGIVPGSSRGSESTFVARSGSSLLLNGRSFRFAGANVHWLALDDSTNYPSQFRVNDALDAAKEMGLTVIRSYSLGISTGCPNCIEPSLGNFNQTALEHVDYAIKAARDHGLRLIIPLTDNGHGAAGGKHNFTDWRGVSDEKQFYSNPQVIRDFETYISTLLERVNIYTGIPNKDDPAIFAWETGNELQPPTSWTQTISTYLKSIDRNHLVIDGKAGIDANAARLPSVDILSSHSYPKRTAKINADARAAVTAGKAFIVGEFDWNDANGGDPLGGFLASMQSNSAVAGDAFWELWSHDDHYGYVGSDRHYTLYYPGDTAAMRVSMHLLRAHAYAMRNQQVPPDSTPGSPVLGTVIRNGPSNILIWRGTAIAASYSIEISTSSPGGPWTVICKSCATDSDTPWVDAKEPMAPLWYRVTAYNLSGVAGPPSVSYQAGSMGMLIDNLNDWSRTYQHSSNLTFDTTSAQYMGGDTSRLIRTKATHEFVTWRQAHTVSFQAIAYFWPSEPVSPFSFYISGDGKNWTAAVPGVVSFASNWLEYIYTLRGFSGVNYVKVAWNNTSGQPWNPNLGTVSILY